MLIGRLLGKGRHLYRELVSTAVSEGFQLTERALKKLEESETPIEDLLKTIKYMKTHNPDALVIDVDNIVQVIEKKEEVMQPMFEETQPIYHPKTSIENLIGEDQRIEGVIEEFRTYFLNRYYAIRGILGRRRINFIPVSEAASVKESEEFFISVMVQNKHERTNSIVLEVDDPSGNMEVIIPKKNQRLYEEATHLVNDVVVGLKVKKTGGFYILSEIIYPDLEEKMLKNLPPLPDLYVCLISDIHVGSKHFREDLFQKFLDWINRGRDGVVKYISHLVIAGDLVEGVGVYPGQENDLMINNVEDQLRKAAELLADVPENIEIVFSPGNHEPVRKALPQPPLQKRYREIINAKHPTHFVSNPAILSIEGRRILIYHGQGLDELIQSMPNVSYSNLSEKAGMIISSLLRFRHLAPVYGENTQLLPMSEDRLVVTEAPHVLQTGHIHVTVNTSYHGVLLVNAGAWQDQTEFQRSLGMEPMVGYAALFNLARLEVRLKYFGA